MQMGTTAASSSASVCQSYKILEGNLKKVVGYNCGDLIKSNMAY